MNSRLTPGSRLTRRSRLTPGIVLILLVAAATTVAIVRRSAPPLTEMPLTEIQMGAPILDPDEEVAYVCPIHPDYTSEIGGRCPRDGMMLVEANPYDSSRLRAGVRDRTRGGPRR